MIDKTKFLTRDYQPNKETLKGFRFYGYSRYNNDMEIYKTYLAKDSSEEMTFEEKKNKHRLALTLVYDTKYSNHKLYVEGSLRKWYYGKYNIRDFSFGDFCDCIYLLSKKLDIEVNTLWNSEVTKLETGVTLRLRKEHKGIVHCISRYKNFKKNIYEDKGIKFKGKNYHIIFYDKIREIYNDKDKLERSYDKITKNNFLFRYEIQGHKVSGMTMFKGKADTLQKIKVNWKYLCKNGSA